MDPSTFARSLLSAAYHHSTSLREAPGMDAEWESTKGDTAAQPDPRQCDNLKEYRTTRHRGRVPPQSRCLVLLDNQYLARFLDLKSSAQH